MLDFYVMTQVFYLDKYANKQCHQLSIKKCLNELCLAFGSTIEGRFNALKKLDLCNYKCPLIIDDYGNYAYIITRNFKAVDLLIIRVDKLIYFKAISKNKTLLYFDNFSYEVDVDVRIIKRQMQIISDYRKFVFKRRNELHFYLS